jgi:hypothetical protein
VTRSNVLRPAHATEEDSDVKPYLAALPIAALALAAPAVASGATLAVSPVKACYRSGESFTMSGAGFTPNAPVNVAANNATLTGSPLGADALGAIGSGLTLGQTKGQQTKTLVATDVTNPALTASVSLLVSAVAVTVKPNNGAAGRLVRVSARGFTTGKTLYAHVSKNGKSKANFKIAKLKGDCRKGSARKKLFASNTPSGTYKVQFDTKRKRSSKTQVKSVYTVTIFPMARGGRASAASAGGPRVVWAPVL